MNDSGAVRCIGHQSIDDRSGPVRRVVVDDDHFAVDLCVRKTLNRAAMNSAIRLRSLYVGTRPLGTGGRAAGASVGPDWEADCSTDSGRSGRPLQPISRDRGGCCSPGCSRFASLRSHSRRAPTRRSTRMSDNASSPETCPTATRGIRSRPPSTAPTPRCSRSGRTSRRGAGADLWSSAADGLAAGTLGARPGASFAGAGFSAALYLLLANPAFTRSAASESARSARLHRALVAAPGGRC